MIISHIKYEIEGIVQGVGFRPFVYALALKHSLKGDVLNDSSGVKISLEGTDSQIESFEKEMYTLLPPLARIDQLKRVSCAIKNFENFAILESKSLNSKHSLVSCDFAMCTECLSEMRDKKDRRYNYVFINCTNCGPRYSIIKTVPYDRPNTTMRVFKMCKECNQEYSNPLNRRYHAQPISCKNCGPTLSLKDIDASLITTGLDALKRLSDFIKKGHIVALKGMGGFHLICDATQDRAIENLREKKNRPSKPFAVMMKSIEHIESICEIDDAQRSRVVSSERPIVILKAKQNNLSPLIAPFIDRLGVFLTYTPLHVKLLDFLDTPIVATSANISGEPIIACEKELRAKLGGIVEYYLDYDREIVNSSDDSVLQVIGKRDLVMRASRGITPLSIKVNSSEKRKILAVGAHQKNSIAIFLNNQIILSPHIGDLDNIATFEAFQKMLKTFRDFYDFKPDLIVCDKHPLYESTKWAKLQNVPIVQVQHHYAHVLACMFEHDIDEQVLGVAWDGTGYGDDETIWGGEFLICDRDKYKRVAYFEPFLLLGGDASIRDIKRIALSMILDCEEDEIYMDFLGRFKTQELNLLKKMHKKALNSPKCSAVGRLFDMVGVVAGVCDRVSYDGKSGLILESLYDEKIKESYSIYLDGEVIRYKHIIKEMIRDKEPSLIASKFINSLVDIVFTMSQKYSLKTLLSGGVFQNRTLLENIIKKDDTVIFQNRLPINDGSIAIGQLASILKLNSDKIW